MFERFPGTNIPAESITQESAKLMLDNLFAGGGLVLSQVTALGNVEVYSVQNWVKRGFVSPPVAKKYTKRQFCRLVLINMLRDCMPIADITELLSYINGVLSDESDDTVSDDLLYEYFIGMLSRLDSTDPDIVESTAKLVTQDYSEPRQGAAERLTRVLCIIYFAYRAALLRHESEARINMYVKKI